MPVNISISIRTVVACQIKQMGKKPEVVELQIITMFHRADTDIQDKVVGFDDMRRLLQDWFEKNWLGRLIVHESDMEASDQKNDADLCCVSFNPTIENIAMHLRWNIFPQLLYDNWPDVFVSGVTVGRKDMPFVLAITDMH